MKHIQITVNFFTSVPDDIDEEELFINIKNLYYIDIIDPSKGLTKPIENVKIKEYETVAIATI